MYHTPLLQESLQEREKRVGARKWGELSKLMLFCVNRTIDPITHKSYSCVNKIKLVNILARKWERLSRPQFFMRAIGSL